LIENIENKNFCVSDKNFKKLPKTEEHKRKISETISRYMCITDGEKNIKILKISEIPNGFVRGMTKKKKLVGEVGLEPTK
jgi:hypothetical protein